MGTSRFRKGPLKSNQVNPGHGELIEALTKF
jgi:hypothetical protein